VPFVSFIRGINVGGNKMMSMADVKTLYESLGLKDVRSHLQTGNIIFQCAKGNPAKLGKRIENAMEKKFGFHRDVMIRTPEQLEAVIKRNPFKKEQTDPSWLVVMFLTGSPDKIDIENLTEAHKGPEKFHIAGEEMYVYYPSGMGRSKLSNAFIEKKLKVAGTARNWNVVTKLAAMMKEP